MDNADDYYTVRLEYHLNNGKSKSEAKIAAIEDYYKQCWAVPSTILIKF